MRAVVTVGRGGLSGSITAPPSKSYTHRAVLLASLAEGRSEVRNPLHSRDTRATIAACRLMGARITEGGGGLVVEGCSPQTPEDVVDVENSGTTLRLMASALALAPGYSVLTGDASIRRRPMQPLLDALRQLGVEAWSTRGDGCAPIVVRGGGMRGGDATVRGDVSSQFISSLLIAAPMAMMRTTIHVLPGLVSKPYIEATLRVMELHGVSVEREGYSRFMVTPGQRYRPASLQVPGDFSSAAIMAAACALVGGRVEIRGLGRGLPQADEVVVEVLRGMGVGVEWSGPSLVIEAAGDVLDGGRFDLSDAPDLLPLVAVLGLKARGVEVVGVAHARFKETDRVAVLARELSKLGASVVERPDGLVVGAPRELRRVVLDAHGDHRLFMAFSLASMLVEGGIPVEGVDSVDVSYPSFLEDLVRLGARVEVEG